MEVEMSKVLFVIQVHSLVDVITNSSSELFVLDTDKSLEMVKEILEEATKLDNKANSEEKSFEDVFDNPFISKTDDAGESDWGITGAEGKICFFFS
jgi:hypothetical protein